MKVALVNPDNYTYSTLIKGIKNMSNNKYNNLDQAFILMDELIESKITPDEILFNCLIDACVRYNNLDKAKDT